MSYVNEDLPSGRRVSCKYISVHTRLMKKNVDEVYQSDFSRHSFVSRTPTWQLIQDSVSKGHGGLDILLWTRGVSVAGRGHGHPVGQTGTGAQVTEAERRTVQDVQIRAATKVLRSLLGLAGEVFRGLPYTFRHLSVQRR